MTGQISTDAFKRELLDLLSETFERTQGIFLDRGTSLLETLETITAEEASRPTPAAGPSIAAQVEHVRFYLQVLLEGCLQGKEIGKVDWEKSWQLQQVTPDTWEALKQRLRETYQSVLAAIGDLEVWGGEDDIGASLAILAHTACHLGAMRQSLRAIR